MSSTHASNVGLFAAAVTLAALAACTSPVPVAPPPPPPPTVAGSIVIGAESTGLSVGGTLPLVATVTDTLGAPLTAPVTWTSASPSIATVSSFGLATGISAGTAVVTAAVGGLNAAVTLTVNPSQPLRLVVTPTARSATALVGTTPPSDNVRITLSGDASGKTVWTASALHPAAVLTATTGTGPGTATWTRNTAGLAVGVYVDTIIVVASGAAGSPAVILDTLHVIAVPSVPTLLVSPASRTITVPWGDTAVAGTATASVVGPGAGTPIISPFSHKSWTSFASYQSNGTVSWPHNTSGLAVGTYTDSISVQATISNQLTTVRIYDTLVIAPGPGPLTLQASPIARSASVAIGTMASSETAAVVLGGKNGNSTTWTATRTAPWVTLTTPSGIGTGSVGWRRSAVGLAAGIYYDTITVRANGTSVPAATIYDTLRIVGPPLAAPITMAATTGWAGSPVSLYSQAFRTRGAGALLHFGSAAIQLSRIDDTTLAATIPTTASAGVVTPTIELDGYTVAFAPLAVYGYSSVSVLPMQINSSAAYAWPKDGRAMLLGGTMSCTGFCPGGVVYGMSLFNLDANTVSTFANIGGSGCQSGPAPSYADSVFVVCTTSGQITSAEAWRLFPTPVRVAVTSNLTTLPWFASQLGPNEWFILSKYYVTTPAVSIRTQQPQSVHFSPRHDRVTYRTLGLVGGASPTQDSVGGIPVFAAPSGDIAYVVSQLTNSAAVDFSSDGDLLAIAGSVPTNFRDSTRLLVLQAATGQVLGDIAFGRARVVAAVFDPYRSLIYVAIMRSNRPTILALARNTLKLVGEMQTPDGFVGNCCDGSGTIVLNGQDGLYLWGGNGSQNVLRFALPPVTGVRRQ